MDRLDPHAIWEYFNKSCVKKENAGITGARSKVINVKRKYAPPPVLNTDGSSDIKTISRKKMKKQRTNKPPIVSLLSSVCNNMSNVKHPNSIAIKDVSKIMCEKEVQCDNAAISVTIILAPDAPMG